MKYTTFFLFLLTAFYGKAQDFTRSPFQDIGVNTFTSADFDGDGYVDVFGVDIKFGSPADLLLFVNNSNGGAVSFQKTVLVANHGAYCNPDAADVDGDGDIDIVIANGDTYELALLLNNGDGTFVEVALGVTGGFDLEFHDLDNDGDLDIVSMEEQSNLLDIFINDGSQTFTKSNLVSSSDNLESFAVGDLDNDDDLDIVAGYDEIFDNQLILMKNDGNNQFESILMESGSDGYPYLADVAIADLNKDGLSEIVGVSRSEFAAWINQGSLQFERQKLADYTGTSGFGFLNVTLADFSGEGALDAVMGDNDGPIVWYRNTGLNPLTFEKRTVGSVSPALSFETADFDKDNDVDIVVSNFDFWWYENNYPQSPNQVRFSEDLQIQVYPNPFKDHLILQNLPQDGFNYALYDSAGRVVSRGTVKGNILLLPDLMNGAYLLSLENADTGVKGTTWIVK